MRSYKITDNFYLNEYTLQDQDFKNEESHQYIIIDRSGSMYRELNKIVDSIEEYVNLLEEGTKVSIGFFSSTSEYGLSVPYTLTKEKDSVIRTLNTYRTDLGTTNFYEILCKIKEDCKENSSLFFFTDGCHNCGPFSNVLQVLQELSDKLDVSVFVGCGRIDRQNMTDMAKIANGAFIQLNSFNEFKSSLNNFKESVKELGTTQKVTIPENVDYVCSILGRNVINYNIKDNTINYKFSNKGNKIYFTSETPLYEVTPITEVCARILIYNLVHNNNVPKALEILNILQDKYFIRKLYNTFTADEYAKIEDELLKAIFDTTKRYKEGKVNYIVDNNSLCVVDILSKLADSDAVLHLNDKDFVYNHISRKSEQTDGAKIKYPEAIQAKASQIIFNNTRLNVNLQVYYKAVVPLNTEEFEPCKLNENLQSDLIKYEIGNEYQITCTRNYNIIADAKLNTPKLVLSNLTKELITELGEFLTLREDGKYILDLSNLSLINRSYLNNTSAANLGKAEWEAYKNGVKLSVINYLIKTQTPEEPGNVDKAKFLLENFYIKNDTYNPPKVQVESTDQYNGYEFSVNFKGFSKPTASAVIKKINQNQDLTQRENIVAFYYNMFKDTSLPELEAIKKAVVTQNRKNSLDIQKSKFAIILINRGCMDEFRDRTNMVLEIPLLDYELKPVQVETEFKIKQISIKI